MSHSVSTDVLKAMRESYALTRELGLPNILQRHKGNLQAPSCHAGEEREPSIPERLWR